MTKDQAILEIKETFNINAIYAHRVFLLADKSNLIEDSSRIISEKPKQPITIKPNFAKAAKSDTKNALSELLKRVVSEKPEPKQPEQESGHLNALLEQFIVSDSRETSQPITAQPATKKERLEQIFASSQNYRGSDDLPERTSKQTQAIREVPADVLESVFHS